MDWIDEVIPVFRCLVFGLMSLQSYISERDWRGDPHGNPTAPEWVVQPTLGTTDLN
jgi:hypothetical protein